MYYYSRNITKTRGFLVDRGSNGGLAKNDVHTKCKNSQIVNAQGIDSHQFTNIPLITDGVVTHSQCEPVINIIIMNHYAYISGGKYPLIWKNRSLSE